MLPDPQSVLTFADLDADGDQDIFVGLDDGTIAFILNIGTATRDSWASTHESFLKFGSSVDGNPFKGVDVGDSAALAFADVDGDGDLDAFVGDKLGRITYFRNDGTAGTHTNGAVSWTVPLFSRLEFDSVGNPFKDVLPTTVSFFPLEHATPALADVDGDGDIDAVVGDKTGCLTYFRNTGS
jgi:hypothetical protein